MSARKLIFMMIDIFTWDLFHKSWSKLKAYNFDEFFRSPHFQRHYAFFFQSTYMPRNVYEIVEKFAISIIANPIVYFF